MEHGGQEAGRAEHGRREGRDRTTSLDYGLWRGLGLGQLEGHLHGAVHLNGRRQRGTGLLPLTCLGIQVYAWVGYDPLNGVDPTELSTEGGLFTTTRQHVKHLVLGLSYTDVQEAAFAARLATDRKKSYGQCGVGNASMGPHWLWRGSP
jgi:hypothetical protein